MPYFPYVNSYGLLTQRPYKSARSFRTTDQTNPFARPYSFANIGSGLTNYPQNPQVSYQINFPAITDAEFAVINTFFKTTVQGALLPFSYLDPNGNLVAFSENFGNAAWTKTGLTVGSAVSDPFGGTLATSISSTVANGLLYTTVIPDGGVAGYVFNGSVWARAASGGQQLFIGFLDSGFSVLASKTVTLSTTLWTRISCSFQCATSSYLRLLIGGNNTWAAGNVISLFGAQCSPTAGAGPYRKTPGAEGLHTKCRFDTDTLKRAHLGPNQISVSLPIQEFF